MRNKYLRYTVSTLFMALIFVSAYMIYFFNKDITQKSDWIQKVYTMKLSNQNINALLSKKTHSLNYAQINQNIFEIDSILTNMKNDPALESFLKDEFYQETYDKVSEKFQKKKEFILDFTSSNSVLNNSLRYMNTLIEEEGKQRSPYSQRLILLHGSLLQIGISAKVDTKSIQKEIGGFQNILKTKEYENIHLYLQHAQTVLEEYKQLNSVEQSIIENNFDKQLDTLISQLKAYISDVTKNIKLTIEVLIAFIFILLFSIIYMLNKKILQEAELRMFKEAVQASDNFILITDKNHLIEYANDSFLKTTGYSKEEILGKTPAVLQSGLHSNEFYKELNDVIAQGKKWSGEFINKDASGKVRYEKATITPITNNNGAITHYLAIKLDITEDKNHQYEIEKKNREIKKRYYTDYLTGLGNRNLLMKSLRQNKPGRLYYINIDNFSHIKTFYGLHSSDKIIKLVANVLKEIQDSKRELNPSLFRITLDEFCFWCPYPAIEAAKIMETIHEKIVKKTYFIHSTPLKISITLGASSNTKTNPNRFIEAEIAHHNARKSGLNFEVYKEKNSIEADYRNNIIIAGNIQEALETDNVLIYFQPIFDITTETVYSYEILCRLRKSDGEILLPGQFLSISQKSNFYHLIMFQVIEKVFECFEKSPTCRFSINISSLDIMHKPTMNLLMLKLSETKNPQNLSVEILESENIEDYDIFKEEIKRIKSFGCTVGIDDFGSGHSNYYRLSKIDVDYLKIDGSIIKELHKDSYSQVVLDTIMTFANEMNFPVVAEHVHCQEVLEKVKEHNIQYAQGFFLAKPSAHTKLHRETDG